MPATNEYVHVPSGRYPDEKAFTLPQGTKIVYESYFRDPEVVAEVHDGKIVDIDTGTAYDGLTKFFISRDIGLFDAYSSFGGTIQVRNAAGMDVSLSGVAEYQLKEKRRIKREKIAKEDRELGTKFYPGVMEEARAMGYDPRAVITLVNNPEMSRINRGHGLFEFRVDDAVILATAGGKVAQVRSHISEEPKRFPTLSYRGGRWREANGAAYRPI
jgi:hypothetical protein